MHLLGRVIPPTWAGDTCHKAGARLPADGVPRTRSDDAAREDVVLVRVNASVVSLQDDPRENLRPPPRGRIVPALRSKQQGAALRRILKSFPPALARWSGEIVRGGSVVGHAPATSAPAMLDPLAR